MLPTKSLLVESIQSEVGSVEPFRSKDMVIFADQTTLANEKGVRFDDFAFVCRKGMREKFLHLNQDFMVIQNVHKTAKVFAVFEGLGINAGSFIDFVKVYLTLALFGNSILQRNPEKALQLACEHVKDMIDESMFDFEPSWSGVAFSLCLIINERIYVCNMGSIKVVLY